MVMMKLVAILLAVAAVALAGGAGRMMSRYSKADFPLTADPDAPQWKVAGVVAENGPKATVTPGHRTEIRSRWTEKNLYFLYVCPYEELYLHPNPTQTEETNELWDWDVAEAFIGTDFKDIRRYKEFQVSPQGEWVDLDINRNVTPADHNWKWNSGYEVKARLDKAKKVWYGEMRIPMASIGVKPEKGIEMRLNLYRIQGPPPNRKMIAWQPTHQDNYHVPEAFGRLVLK
jgi:Carbohydrate family 9 binding domain-like